MSATPAITLCARRAAGPQVESVFEACVDELRQEFGALLRDYKRGVQARAHQKLAQLQQQAKT